MQEVEDPAAVVRAAFRDACRLELDAPKPGNVHRFASGHGMTVADFERSAEAAAPAIADPRPGCGRRVLAAVRATRHAVGLNTNLGILLLCAPLAEAFLVEGARPRLEAATRRVLAALGVDDARAVFEAIRLANPGGLGRAERYDVAEDPVVGLGEAMRAAAGRDRIAWNHVNGFADIFERGLPWWRGARARGRSAVWACAEVHLRFLAGLPDTHIARKSGQDVAEAVRNRAAPLCAALQAAGDPAAVLDRLLAFDAELKAEGLNPGTTADLTVATVFAALLEDAARPRAR
jgi:triphosphoribosyl-dephospho-CoA synthase